MVRNLQDTSGLGIDAEPSNPLGPHLEATPAVGTEAVYQHYWYKKLWSNVFYSYVAVNYTYLANSSTYNHGTYMGGNLIWSLFGSLNVGGEVLYGWIMQESGMKANDTRFQFRAKYSFVKVDPDQK